MPKHLVIVESPTKAKTITKFLGNNYKVESSYGHVRDLPKKGLGVDIEKDFEPTYEVPEKSDKIIKKIKGLAQKSNLIYFATDEDREGEAISWHLKEMLNPPEEKIKRIVFHEITKEALEEALNNPREIDMNLVDAQQARRILDRLVGYKLSPFLWRKVTKGLSAGRVQSVAVRLIVEREREIQNFKTQEYWTIDGTFYKENEQDAFEASLYKIKNKSLKKFDIKNENKANELVTEALLKKYFIDNIESKETKKSPYPPFTTSTLQQSAHSRLGFSTKQTMMIAQQLYEGVEIGGQGSQGLITYMRTDSMNLSNKFLQEASDYIISALGNQYYGQKPKIYKTKSKTAQEAHEAIRPTDVKLTPEDARPYLDSKQFKLYSLIWSRAVASQMADAKILSTTMLVVSDDKSYVFKAKGAVMKFDGFSKIYSIDAKETILPLLNVNDSLLTKEIKPNQHFTEPPSRYSEAGLVKAMEEYGIGRPSTYAPTINTIQERNYVIKEDKKLKPTDIAFTVNDILVEHFPQIVDYQFTAEMEDSLDEIAAGKKKWRPTLREFYDPFIKNLKEKDKTLSKKELTEEKTEEKCEKCGSPMVIKIGRFGKFLACSNYPECKHTKPLPGSVEEQRKEETTQEKCEKCGKPMAVKYGRFGAFLGCTGYPECKNIKSIEKKTGVKCPKCAKGEIVEKRSKAKRIFYACNQYPQCEFALWSKPNGDKCPECGSLLVFGAKETLKCGNKECDYKTKIEK